jgi:integral membrane sensor domain MASE1
MMSMLVLQIFFSSASFYYPFSILYVSGFVIFYILTILSGNNPYLSTKGLIDVKCNLMNERKNRNNNNKLMIPNQHY